MNREDAFLGAFIIGSVMFLIGLAAAVFTYEGLWPAIAVAGFSLAGLAVIGGKDDE